MTILAIDFSLTNTGVAVIEDGEASTFRVTSKPEQHWWEFPDRVASIISNVFIHARLSDPDPVVIIESPAYMARSSSMDKMLGGWWLAVDQVQVGHGVTGPILKATPTQVKKFATGNGNAGKDEVLAAVIRRYPDVNVATNDEADALTLAAIGAAVMGEPFNGGLADYQRKIVDDVRRGKVSG